MAIVDMKNVSKSFGSVQAVDDVTFEIEKGELFGLLGPNGAGKTTAIRCMLDIFKPDSGSISILDGEMSEDKKDRIGYMPEERGLYQDITLERCLTYLGSLKGLNPQQVKENSQKYLEYFDLADHGNRKVKELSKGMQQKAQVISTLLHEPELLIVDEPFAGLDPVNTRLVKDLLREQHEKGVTIILCSHQMNMVEELCERILLVDHGKTVLYGKLNEIRKKFSGNTVTVQTSASLPKLPGVEKVESLNGKLKLTLTSGTLPQEILQQLVKADIPLEGFNISTPNLDEIFVNVVSGRREKS
ncbi:ABC transporter ATP-binding protein [Chloroflexota bacterium]